MPLIHNIESYKDGRDINSDVLHYYRRDHLGNIREVWKSATNASPALTVQRMQYYPSGLPWADCTGADYQNRKYNGKEFIEMHGYDSYDYHARHMYPALMRFTTPDPLAEKYYSISPYAYCNNNPERFIDPTGMFVSPYFDRNGNFLGVDENGYSGLVMITNKKIYEQALRNKDGSVNSRSIKSMEETKNFDLSDLADEAKEKVLSHVVNENLNDGNNIDYNIEIKMTNKKYNFSAEGATINSRSLIFA